MMRLFLIFLLIPFFSYGSCDKIQNLSLIQKHNLHKSFHYGKEFDLGYTLAAIAFVESSAGNFRLNVRTNDLGLYQINATTAERTLGIENHFEKLALHQRLIHDDKLAASIAITTLLHFDKGNWREMLQSYNEGYRWRTNKESRKKAEAYANRVADTVKLLKKCEKHWL
jgi:hypothetical protein